MSALEKCSFGRRPAAGPLPRHSDDEALFEPMSRRLRRAVTAGDSASEHVFDPMRSERFQGALTTKRYSNPCREDHEVPSPLPVPH